LKPADFADPHLFVHRDLPPQPPAVAPMAAADTAPGAQAPATVQTALGLRGGAGGPAAAATTVADAARAPSSGELKVDPAVATSSLTASDAPAAIAPVSASPAEAPVPMPPAAPPALAKVAPANKAPIAIFISRREKKIYVRQDFTPLFEAPVTIADPERPLGTLVFTALGFTGADRTTLRWNAVVFPAEPPPEPKRKAEQDSRYDKHGHARRYVEEREKSDLSPPQTPAQALARISIPQATLDDISQLIVPGSTLIVSDHGLGDETGEGTNFVVVVR
jgi:hypothetical protein